MSRTNGKAKSQLVTVADEFSRAREAWRSNRVAKIDNLYRSARQTRFSRKTNQISSNATAEDQHYASEADYFRIVEIARDLDRNDLVVGQGISRMINNVIQTGFSLDPKTGNAGADELIKYLWADYTENRERVDHEGEKSFAELERLVLRHIVVDGDIVVLPLASGALQVVENHRLRTPWGLSGDDYTYTIHGVRLDTSRRRQWYYLTTDDVALNVYPSRQDVATYAARDTAGNRLVHHLYYPKRMTQTRGVSRLAPITDAAAMHDDIQFAKLVQQQGVSVWALIRERQLGFDFDTVPNPEPGWSTEADPCSPGQTRPIRNISAGMWYTGYPGESIKGFSPNVPNPTFFDHARQIMEIIAINMDLPLILFLLDASETNFSGWRGAFDQAKVAFRVFQSWFASVFHREIYRWKMRQWSTPGSRLANPLLVRMRERGLDLFAHEWVYPTWPYIEPLKDASADLLEISNGLCSPRRVHAKRGRDWDVVSSEIVDDFYQIAVKAATAAEAFAEQFPEQPRPDWREFARIPMPDGSQMGLQQVIKEAEEPAGPEEPEEPDESTTEGDDGVETED